MTDVSYARRLCTLQHRLVCPAVCPPEGWQQAPDDVAGFLGALDDNRRRLLCTRGLLLVKVVAPQPVQFDSFQWLRPPSDDLDSSDWCWFIDGSLHDEPRRFARRVGFGIFAIGYQIGKSAKASG